MRFLFLTIKFLPYWSIPMILIFSEMALIFRRRGNRPVMYRMAGIAFVFLLITLFFFVFRWDKNLYPWIRDHLVMDV